MPSHIAPDCHHGPQRGPENPGAKGESLAELERVIAAGGFWRLVPDWVAREYAEPTRELTERVRNGLRRLNT